MLLRCMRCLARCSVCPRSAAASPQPPRRRRPRRAALPRTSRHKFRFSSKFSVFFLWLFCWLPFLATEPLLLLLPPPPHPSSSSSSSLLLLFSFLASSSSSSSLPPPPPHPSSSCFLFLPPPPCPSSSCFLFLPDVVVPILHVVVPFSCLLLLLLPPPPPPRPSSSCFLFLSHFSTRHGISYQHKALHCGAMSSWPQVASWWWSPSSWRKWPQERPHGGGLQAVAGGWTERRQERPQDVPARDYPERKNDHSWSNINEFCSKLHGRRSKPRTLPGEKHVWAESKMAGINLTKVPIASPVL